MTDSKIDLVKVSEIAEYFNIPETKVIEVFIDASNRLNLHYLYYEKKIYYSSGMLFNTMKQLDDYYNSLIINESRIFENSTDSVPIENKKVIYFLINDKEIVYIGITNKLILRMASHLNDKKFNRVSFFDFEETVDKLEMMEDVNIRHYRPYLNAFILSDECYFTRIFNKIELTFLEE